MGILLCCDVEFLLVVFVLCELKSVQRWHLKLKIDQGTQIYFGGQAFVIIPNSIFPTFLRMKNTLPESAGITTPGLIGFVLLIILYFPIIYYIPAYKIQKLLEVQVVVATATLLGIMAWAIHVSSSFQGFPT